MLFTIFNNVYSHTHYIYIYIYIMLNEEKSISLDITKIMGI